MPPRNEEAPAAFAGRVFAVMEAVAGAGAAIGIVEVAEQTGLPQPTVHRIVTQLEGQGLLVRDTRSKKIRVGPRLVGIARSVLAAAAQDAPRRAILRGMSAAADEGCGIGVLDGDEVLYIDSVEVSWPLALQFRPGARVPLHCTSIGKLFLAYMHPQQRARLLDHYELRRFTPQTITERPRLEALLAEIRERGYAVTSEEYVPGVVGVAVPVFAPARRMWAGLSVRGPHVRLSPERAVSLLPALLDAAARLTELDAAASPPSSVEGASRP